MNDLFLFFAFKWSMALINCMAVFYTEPVSKILLKLNQSQSAAYLYSQRPAWKYIIRRTINQPIMSN